ncbi:MAG: SDR family oxidoreductase [Actinomycetota bacterium]|nr:SDR family oxidoreductase [Actinomycetota bacterium]
MNLEISDKSALVTGGSAGLGLAIAKALAAEGVRVAIASRSADKLGRALAELPRGSAAFQADLSSPSGASALLEEVRRDFGSPDILIANAGGPRAGGYAAVTIDDYRAAIEQNLLSMIALCNGVVGEMRAKGFGRIIAITSLYVKQPSPELILSNTARTGLTAYLKTLSAEVAAYGVTVNSLLPGLHRTERLIELSGEDAQKRAEALVPAKALGDPESFGKVAAFVASRHAWYMTGQSLVIDGGAVRSLL